MNKTHFLIVFQIFLAFLTESVRGQFFYTPIEKLVDVTKKTNTQKDYRDIANCICDQTQNLCNLQCCCDPDCNSDIVNNWRNANRCEVQSYYDVKLKEFPSCSSYWEDPQNPRLAMDQYSHMTCIIINNLPYSGYFYLQNLLNTKLGAIEPNGTTISDRYKNEKTLGTTVNRAYTQNTTIKIKVENNIQNFKYPASDIYGYCTNFKESKFFLRQQSICRRKLKLNQQECEKTNQINAQYYKDLKFAFQLENVDTTYPPEFPDGEISIPVFSKNAVTGLCSCQNYVREANFLFTTAEAAISKLQIQFVYQNILEQKCDSSIQISQHFIQDIKLVDQDAQSAYSVSGTPGYQKGKLLLIGTQGELVQDEPTQVIYRPLDYFRIIGSKEDGSCEKKLSDGELDKLNLDDVYMTYPVNFGEDYQISCQLNWKKADFTENCSGTNTSFISKFQIFNNFQDNITYFGKYGVANHQFFLDWLSLNSSQALYTQPDDLTRSSFCNAPERQVLVIYYTQDGAQEDPQNYLLSVEQYHPRNYIWQWGDEVQADATKSFNIIFEIKFVKINYSEMEAQVTAPLSQIVPFMRQVFDPILGSKEEV